MMHQFTSNIVNIDESLMLHQCSIHASMFFYIQISDVPCTSLRSFESPENGAMREPLNFSLCVHRYMPQSNQTAVSSHMHEVSEQYCQGGLVLF